MIIEVIVVNTLIRYIILMTLQYIKNYQHLYTRGSAGYLSFIFNANKVWDSSGLITSMRKILR